MSLLMLLLVTMVIERYTFLQFTEMATQKRSINVKEWIFWTWSDEIYSEKK